MHGCTSTLVGYVLLFAIILFLTLRFVQKKFDLKEELHPGKITIAVALLGSAAILFKLTPQEELCREPFINSSS